MSRKSLDINELIELDAEFARHIKRDCGRDDPECAHTAADRYLCNLLTELGFEKTVEAFMAVQKWYA